MVVSSYIIGHFISRKEGWNVMFVYDSCIPSLTFYILFDNLFSVMMQISLCLSLSLSLSLSPECDLMKANRTPDVIAINAINLEHNIIIYVTVTINVITFLICVNMALIFVSHLKKSSWPFSLKCYRSFVFRVCGDRL